MQKADLHIHSTASDGKMTPEEVVKAADDLNLSVIALTDHDTIKGVELAVKAAENLDVELMPGVEITTTFNNREIHLLAYNFDVNDKPFNALLKSHQKARVHRARWIINQLGKKGLELDIDEVVAEAAGKSVGRPHIATTLMKKGYIASAKEAFIRYLSDDALGPIQNNYTSITEVISEVKQACGVSVLAHPGRLYNQSELLQLVKTGMDGLEVIHPSHNYQIQKRMEAFALNHNLLTTGGSDFHGKTSSYYRHFGVLTISMRQTEKIKALSEQRKNISV